MGVQTGLGAAFYVDGYDISGDIGSLGRINTARGVTELTGIDKSAFERAHLHRDGGLEFTAWFNKAAGQAHPVLSAMPTGDRIATYLHRTTLGASAAGCVCKQLDYAPNRAADGSLAITTTAESNGYGLEWGRTLTAGKRTDTGATLGTAIDTAATASFGLQAYLQVFSFSGTDATIKIQDSADNVSFADVGSAAFTAVTTAPTKERIQTGRTEQVDRYVRVVTTTSAGFTSLVFAVVVVKNSIATVF